MSGTSSRVRIVIKFFSHILLMFLLCSPEETTATTEAHAEMQGSHSTQSRLAVHAYVR